MRKTTTTAAATGICWREKLCGVVGSRQLQSGASELSTLVTDEAMSTWSRDFWVSAAAASTTLTMTKS